MSNTYKEYKIDKKAGRILLVTDIHNCHIDWHETSTADRMNMLCKTLKAEYERNPYDAILSLGDYSLDFWKWDIGGSFLFDPPVSNTNAFVEKYVSEIPTDFFMIPGNHEQYGNERWKKITGRPREYVITYGDTVFVMLDTFAGNLDPSENHDGVYTGINVSLLSEILNNYSDKKVMLCAHDIIILKESDSARELIAGENRIICAFAGHTHRDNTLILPESWRRLPVFYCGDFSYNGGRNREKNWGYRVLDLSSESISTEYVRYGG